MAVSNATNPDNNRRFALIIANSDYKEDPDLSRLIAPAQDADALYSVLRDPNIGGFDEVKIIKNQPSYEISKEIQTFLNGLRPNDMFLLYFSCHGIKNEDGQLYFAATNTRRTILDATAISADFINTVMFKSRSRRKVLLLDCCYSGAFTREFGRKSDKTIHTKQYFDQGRGTIVIAASGAMQYSFEENTLKAEVENPGSIFTHTVVEGLKTGKADLNQDGMISYTELYEYTHDQVIDITPSQIPEISSVGVAGALFIAKNPFKSKEDPNKLAQEGLDYLNKREYLTAIEYSDNGIKIKPNLALAHNIKILIPVVAVVVGTAITVVLFGSGILHFPSESVPNSTPPALNEKHSISHPNTTTNNGLSHLGRNVNNGLSHLSRNVNNGLGNMNTAGVH